jgi:hypothetical protein
MSINISKVNSAEALIWNYFRKKGYEILLGKFIANHDGVGVPDFFIRNNKEEFWVEVKTIFSYLGVEQIKWITRHNKEKIIIAIVNKLNNEIKFLRANCKEVKL